jgi:GMP synthase-like glutamine amidotransferase
VTTTPRPLSIALLECDHVDADLRHHAGDYGDMHAALLAAHAPEITLDHIDVVGGDPLPAVGSHDGIIISGSRQSVTDDLPWIDALTDLVHEAAARQEPLVGICFGHQLIAQAFGGRVERAPVGWGIGIHEATVTSPRPWMDPPADRFRLLVSHQDQVTELPTDAEVLAVSDHAPIAAFQLGSLVGFQGHPEFVPAYAEALMDLRLELIGAAVVEPARATLATPTDHGLVARWIAGFFASAR